MIISSKNCNILLNAADRLHKKDENEVYDSVKKKLDEILKDQTAEEQIKSVKALIAFLDGRLSRTYFLTVTSIAYAMLATTVSTLVSAFSSINKSDFSFLVGFLLIPITLVLTLLSLMDQDFNKAFVKDVLNDKMQELQSQVKEHCRIENELDVCDEEINLEEKVHTYVVKVCTDRK